MPDPNDPALTAAARKPSAASSARLEETTGGPRGSPGAVNFGPPAAAGEVGTLGPYRVLKELGKGGMGAVYLAIDTRLDRKLALKVMLPEFAANAEMKGRFLREAKAAAKFNHDNVVTVYEADDRDGAPYITMQFLQGYTLDDFLKKKGTPSLRHIIRIARETALGLAAAHKHGLVHRDIKPANLWLEAPNGRVKVLDFGLAKPVGADAELTQSGAVVGTPAYMSPEQARGLKVDHRTDLFSLGAVMYRLCTGQTPFDGPNVMAVLMALGMEDPKPIRELNPGTPEPLAGYIHRLLAKRPEDRPQSAAEVAKDLLAILEQLGTLPANPVVTGEGVAESPGATEISSVSPPVGEDPAVGRAPAKNPPRAEISSSNPVVVDPVPVQPPLVSRMEITAAPESAVAKPDEEEEVTEARLANTRKPKRKPKRSEEPRQSSKGWLIAGGVGGLLLLVGGIALGVVIAGGRQKPTDTVQQKPEEKPPAEQPRPPDTPPPPKPKDKEPDPVTPKPKEKDPDPVPPKPPEPKAGDAPALKHRWSAPANSNLGFPNLYVSEGSDLVLASSNQGEFASYDLKTGAVRPGFRGIEKLGAPHFFPLDGKRVGAPDIKTEEVRVWDEKTGQEGVKMAIPHAPQPPADAKTWLRIYISPNAKYAVAARYQIPALARGEQYPLRVIDLTKKQVVSELNWSGGQIHFTADSSRVLVADYAGRFTWVKLPSGETDGQWTFPPGQSGRYHDVTSMSADGSILGYRGPAGRGALGAGSAIIDGATGKVAHLFSNEYAYNSSVSVSADGRRAALIRVSSGDFSTLEILDWRTKTSFGRASVKTDRSIPTFALSRDGTTLIVAANGDKKIHVFEVDKPAGVNPKLPAVPNPGPAVELKTRWSVEVTTKLGTVNPYFDIDGEVIALAGGLGDWKTAAVDAKTGELLGEITDRPLRGNFERIFPLEKGKFAYHISSGTNELLVWDPKQKKTSRKAIPQTGDRQQQAVLHLSPNERFLAMSHRRPDPKAGDPYPESPLRVIDTTTGKAVLSLDWPPGSTAFAPDSSRILVVDAAERFRWFKLPSGQADGEWAFGQTPSLYTGKGVALSNDGGVLLYDGRPPGKESSRHLLDGKTGAVLHSFPVKTYPPYRGFVSPDGKMVVMVRNDGFGGGHTVEVRDAGGNLVAAVKMPQQGSRFAASWKGGLFVLYDDASRKLTAYELPSPNP